MKVQQRVVASALSVVAVIAFALVPSGCGGSGDRAGFAMPPMPVEASEVLRREMVDRFEVVGTIEALAAVTVVGEIDALITSLPFAEGSTVKKGDLIARLDDGQLAAEVARAEALRDQTKASFERVKSIVGQGAGSPQDLDDASAALKVAEAKIAELTKANATASALLPSLDVICGAVKGILRTGSVTERTALAQAIKDSGFALTSVLAVQPAPTKAVRKPAPVNKAARKPGKPVAYGEHATK